MQTLFKLESDFFPLSRVNHNLRHLKSTTSFIQLYKRNELKEIKQTTNNTKKPHKPTSPNNQFFLSIYKGRMMEKTSEWSSKAKSTFYTSGVYIHFLINLTEHMQSILKKKHTEEQTKLSYKTKPLITLLQFSFIITHSSLLAPDLWKFFPSPLPFVSPHYSAAFIHNFVSFW